MFKQHSIMISGYQNLKFSFKNYLATALLLFLLNLPLNVAALANCPPGCHCDDTTLIVQCGEGQLDVLPIALNPSIQRLVIRSNKIKTIDSSIQFYAELTILDLSSNHLMSIPQRTFAYQKKLQELHLNHNKIGSISNRTFIGLSSLTVLNLRGNLISELHQGTFAPLLKVQELNLGENRINYIDAKTFKGLTQLRILYLDDNALTSVPDPTAMHYLSNLAELYLGTNSLSMVASEAFAELKGLTRLDLKSASLLNISHDSFKGLEALRALDISDNRLMRIPTVGLSHLVRLEELSLGQNDFEVIAEGAFLGLKQLKMLDISGALHLKKVLNDAFAANTNLEYLNLSNNKMLTEFQEGALSGLPHLDKLVLRANSLTTLAEGLFHWKDLKLLDLSENPMACDCRIMWLRDLLLAKNDSSDSDSTMPNILCEFPERLRGEELRNVVPNLIGCSHADPRKQALFGALLVGLAATLTALALVLYRCRRRIRDHLKGGICGSSVLSRKEREYQKTFCDEDYMTRLQHHPCSLGLHSTFPNTYTSHHAMAPAHYSICGMQINDLSLEHQINQKNCFQQLQVPTNLLLPNKKKIMNFESNGGNATTRSGISSNIIDGDDDGSPLAMHAKAGGPVALNTGHYELNHYVKPQFVPPTPPPLTTATAATVAAAALAGDSCYSYADLPFAVRHNTNTTTANKEHKQLRMTHDYFTEQRSHRQTKQQQKQQQPQRFYKPQYDIDIDVADVDADEINHLNGNDDTTSMDFNCMYNNTHYSMPLEPAFIGQHKKVSERMATDNAVVPPALPVRNGSMQHRSVGRRSFSTAKHLGNNNNDNHNGCTATGNGNGSSYNNNINNNNNNSTSSNNNSCTGRGSGSGSGSGSESNGNGSGSGSGSTSLNTMRSLR